MILRAENVGFAYHREHPVLKDVSLEVRPGTVTALFGPNGCGKSTLLRCLNGSLRPQAGKVFMGEHDAMALGPREVAQHIAVVPQDTPTDIPFTASQMVMLGRYAHWDVWGQESADDGEMVRDSLTRMGVADLAGRLFSELSGGERQRVVLARALAQQAPVLLLDEPATHLDIAHQLELYGLIRGLAADGRAVLMVCHDLLVAPMFADVAVLMSAGRIVDIGKPAEALSSRRLSEVYKTHARISWGATETVEASFARACDHQAQPDT